jgi:hypothetical protein
MLIAGAWAEALGVENPGKRQKIAQIPRGVRPM